MATWIDNGDRYYRCSVCGTLDTDTWDWCHGCGAYMRTEPIIDIVRCKECYMCDEEMWCSFYDSIMESDDFCSYGERRE